MKSKIIAILIAILVLLNCTPIYANTFIGSDTIDEIKDIEDVIVEDVNSYTEIEEFEPINNSDINYNKMYRVYSSTGILDNDKLNNETMQYFVEDREYYYTLPIYFDEKNIKMTIDKREKLSAEEKDNLPDDVVKDLESDIGKWIISSIGFGTNEYDYIGKVNKMLQDNNINNANIYILSGITSIRLNTLVTVICPKNNEDAKIFLQSSKLDNDKLYTFDEIKAIAEQDAEELKNLSEGTYGDDATPIQTSVDAAAPTPDNNKIIIISAVSGVAVLAIAIAAICIVKKKKHTKVNNEE